MGEWHKVTLGDVVKFFAGSAFPLDQQGSTGEMYPFFKVSDLKRSPNDRDLDHAANSISEDVRANLKARVVPAGSVVFAKIGEGLRSGRMRITTRDALIDNNLMAAVPKPGIQPIYLHALMQTIGIADFAVGSALPYLKQSTLTSVPVSTPDAATMSGISSILGALGDKITANAIISERARALATAEFNRFLLNFELLNSSYGHLQCLGGGTPSTKNPNFWNGDVHWATPSDMTRLSSPYLFHTERTITQAGLNSCSSRLLPAGSVLMTSRATIGEFAVAQIPTAINQGFIAVVPEKQEEKWWILHHMQKDVDSMKQLANGATFLELNRKTFKEMPFKRPMDKDLKAFHELINPLHGVAIAAEKENKHLADLRDALLPRLLDGTLTVRAAEDLVSDTV